MLDSWIGFERWLSLTSNTFKRGNWTKRRSRRKVIVFGFDSPMCNDIRTNEETLLARETIKKGGFCVMREGAGSFLSCFPLHVCFDVVFPCLLLTVCYIFRVRESYLKRDSLCINTPSPFFFRASGFSRHCTPPFSLHRWLLSPAPPLPSHIMYISKPPG